jgi:hypothetical protein
MTEQLVRLKGHQFDLEALSEHFTSDDLNVRRDEDDHYYLRSTDFDQMSDSSAVEERGRELLEHVNGVAKLLWGSEYRAVEFDAAARIEAEGQRYHSVGTSVTISMRSRATAKPSVIRADETVEDAPQSSDIAKRLVSLADRNKEVADALRFYERGDWINLYKAWEVVCDAAGGTNAVVNNGWADGSERRRFTHTAQSREELGDKARHASMKKYPAPKNPMTQGEAQGFVRSVIQAWVATL